jgi:hypothetical protein
MGYGFLSFALYSMLKVGQRALWWPPERLERGDLLLTVDCCELRQMGTQGVHKKRSFLG